jgi:Uncharacterized conserved protein (DUF2203)
MKPRRKRSRRERTLRLWDWSEANKAVPYLHSVLGSLREHWLEVLSAQRQLERSAKHTAPIKRQQILEMQKCQEEQQRAQGYFDDALEELNRVDAFLLDPVRGTAVIPFRKEDDLAWYVFDHFAQPGLVGWRLHNDPIEECRPLTSLQGAIINGSAAN